MKHPIEDGVDFSLLRGSDYTLATKSLDEIVLRLGQALGLLVRE